MQNDAIMTYAFTLNTRLSVTNQKFLFANAVERTTAVYAEYGSIHYGHSVYFQ